MVGFEAQPRLEGLAGSRGCHYPKDFGNGANGVRIVACQFRQCEDDIDNNLTLVNVVGAFIGAEMNIGTR